MSGSPFFNFTATYRQVVRYIKEPMLTDDIMDCFTANARRNELKGLCLRRQQNNKII